MSRYIDADCPAYRNYCPCRDYDYVELCKFAEVENERTT